MIDAVFFPVLFAVSVLSSFGGFVCGWAMQYSRHREIALSWISHAARGTGAETIVDEARTIEAYLRGKA